MDKFEVGEIAILIASNGHPQAIGLECEILRIGITSNQGNYRDYEIRVKDYLSLTPEGNWCADEYQLRKKKPPEELSSWEEVQKITKWNPIENPITTEKIHEN